MFHIKFLANSVVYLVIINHKSYVNVTAKVMADRMKLTTIAYLQPYYIHWMETSELVHLEKARVPISIPNFYSNEFVCDVIPSTTSHIVLRNPWACE